MENRQNLQYAGDLAKEMQEINKLLPDEGDIENYDTATDRCGGLFSVVCC